jgi:HEAT repeat protein
VSHIFISYHHADVTPAYELEAVLLQAGFSTWVNPDPEAGTSWHEWIESGLRGSFALIVLISPESSKAEQVMYEWVYAWGAHIPLIPVIVRPADFHPRLNTQNPVPFANQDQILQRVQDAASIQLDKLKPDEFDLFDSQDELRPIVTKLYSLNRGEREYALEELANSSHASAFDALCDALQHPIFPGIARRAAEILGEKKDPRAIESLMNALHAENDDVIQAAITALIVLGDPAIPMLVETMRDQNKGARRAAVLALTQIKTVETIPALLEMLRMQDWFASRGAAVVLGELGDSRAVPGLIAALRSEDKNLRECAAKALDQINTPEAREALNKWSNL